MNKMPEIHQSTTSPINLKPTLEAIASASTEIFGLRIPYERMNIIIESRKEYIKSSMESKRAQSRGKIIRDAGKKDLLKNIGKHFEKDRFAIEEILTTGGFYQVNCINNKLGHDVNAFVDNELSLEETALNFLDTLSHEIGHAIMYEYEKKGRSDRKKQLNYGKILGAVNSKLRELRGLDKSIEKDRFLNIFGEYKRFEVLDDIKGTIEELKNELIINTSELVNVGDLLQNAELIGNRYINSINKPPRIPNYKRNQHSSPLSIRDEEIRKEIRKEKEEDDKKRVKEMKERVFQLRKKFDAYSQILTLKRSLIPYLKKLEKAQNKYIKINHKPREISEGWACHYSARVVDWVIKNQPEIFGEYLRTENMSFLHKQSLRKLSERNDVYGIGYLEFEITKNPEEAKLLADIKA